MSQIDISTDSNPFAESAQSYLPYGPVVPIQFGDKRPPVGIGWKGAAAISSITSIHPYCGCTYNIALRLDNFLVLDIDGEEGVASLAKLELEIGPLSSEVIQRSGGGGFHIFFRIAREDLKGLRTKLGEFPKIDFKAGPGHILIMSPSLHPSGNKYNWPETSKGLDHAPPAPPALLKRLQSPTSASSTPQRIGQEGERHNLLLGNAVALFNRGLDIEHIRETLWKQVGTFHDEWPTETAMKEIDGIISWLSKLERGLLFPKSATPYDIADFLTPMLKDTIIHVKNGDWYVRDKDVYKFTCREEIRPLLIKAIEPSLRDFEVWISHNQDEDILKKANAKLSKIKSLSWTDKAIEALAAKEEFCIADTELDPPGVLNFKNGPFNLDGSPASEVICTKQMGISFDPNANHTELFDNFLLQTLPTDSAETLLQVFAHGLRGTRNSQHMWIIEGAAATGKSVFLGLLGDLLGTYASSPDTALLFERKLQSGAANEDLFALRGAKIAVFSEGPDGLAMNGTRVKQLTSGDKLSARPIYGHSMQFENTAELFMMTNHETNLNIDDSGVRRRVKRILFGNVVPETDRDPMLREKLLKEGPAIINRILSMIPKVESEGISISTKIQEDTALLFERQDIMGRFVSEKLAIDPEGTVKGTELYFLYKIWCERNGITAKPTTQFYRNLELKIPGAAPYQLHGAKAYRGISIKSSFNES